MASTLIKVIKEGFGTWQKNLNICLPFVFSSILTFVVAIIVLGCAALLTGASLFDSRPYISRINELPLLLSIGAVILILILGLIINAFFVAGAIGMAKEAMEDARTSLSVMTVYGRRKFASLLFANIIVGFILLAGLIFIILGRLSILPNMAALKLIALAYVVIVSIMFTLAPFAVVIGDFSAVDGVKKGFKIFRAHKLDVFLLGFIVLFIGLVVGFITDFIPHIGLLVNILVSTVIILPLTVLWWSKLYMCVTTPRKSYSW